VSKLSAMMVRILCAFAGIPNGILMVMPNRDGYVYEGQ